MGLICHLGGKTAKRNLWLHHRLLAENTCSVTTLLWIAGMMGVFPGSEKETLAKSPATHSLIHTERKQARDMWGNFLDYTLSLHFLNKHQCVKCLLQLPCTGYTFLNSVVNPAAACHCMNISHIHWYEWFQQQNKFSLMNVKLLFYCV